MTLAKRGCTVRDSAKAYALHASWNATTVRDMVHTGNEPARLARFMADLREGMDGWRRIFEQYPQIPAAVALKRPWRDGSRILRAVGLPTDPPVPHPPRSAEDLFADWRQA